MFVTFLKGPTIMLFNILAAAAFLVFNGLIVLALIWAIIRIKALLACRSFCRLLESAAENAGGGKDAATRSAGRDGLVAAARDAAASSNKFIKSRDVAERIITAAQFAAPIAAGFGDLSQSAADAWLSGIIDDLNPLLFEPRLDQLAAQF